MHNWAKSPERFHFSWAKTKQNDQKCRLDKSVKKGHLMLNLRQNPVGASIRYEVGYAKFDLRESDLRSINNKNWTKISNPAKRENKAAMFFLFLFLMFFSFFFLSGIREEEIERRRRDQRNSDGEFTIQRWEVGWWWKQKRTNNNKKNNNERSCENLNGREN